MTTTVAIAIPPSTNQTLLLRRIRQPLNHILALPTAHHGHTRNLPNPSLQIPIIGRHNVDFALHTPSDNTVVGISTLMVTRQPLKTLVTRQPQGQPEFRAEFFEFGHDAVGYYGDAFGVEAVEEGGYRVEFVLEGVVEEVGVH